MLGETEACFGAPLAQIQTQISGIEVQLSDVPQDTQQQSQEHQQLMDIESWLEREIATYPSPEGQEAHCNNLPTPKVL